MKITIAGAAGRMGQMLIREIGRTEGASLAAALEGAGSNALGSDAAKGIKIVANEINRSFSQANNQGAEAGSGELLLLLNNDTEPAGPHVVGRRITLTPKPAATSAVSSEEPSSITMTSSAGSVLCMR